MPPCEIFYFVAPTPKHILLWEAFYSIRDCSVPFLSISNFADQICGGLVFRNRFQNTSSHLPIMKKYHAMELSELLEESAARGLEYHFSKDRPTMITSLRAFDQARQRENTAAAQHFDSFNDSNDPMYRNRIEVRFGMLSAYISHQQRERQNRVS